MTAGALRLGEDVLAALSAAVCAGRELRLVGQLDRPLYQRVAVALEAGGGVWNRKAKAHLFEGDAAEAIEPILLTGEVVRVKQAFGEFFTPPEVANRVIAAADLRPGLKVLEPSAGRGALATLALVSGCTVACIEIQPGHVEHLKGLPFKGVTEADFLTVAPVRTFDRVVLNPPFARQADIDHVRHACRFLKLGGRLVAIMSAGVLFRQDAKATGFREAAERAGGTFLRLPPDAFKPSGTSVATCLLTLDWNGGDF